MKKILILLLIALLSGSSIVNAQTYQSQNVIMLSNWFDPAVIPEPSYGIKYNGMWGWADGIGNEYAIIGSTAGTYFVNVTNPASPVQSDYVAARRGNCIWHEIKTYQNYCYIVSDDGLPNSLQIVDMSYLPDSVHVVYDDTLLFKRSHTIWVDGDKLYGGSVDGGSVGYSGLAVFDISNPTSPTLLRKIEDDYPGLFSYAHDMYVRNDTIFASCGFNGLFTFRLDANNHFISLGSLTGYFNQGYNHSSALSADGNSLIFCEEIPTGQPVRSVDVSDLSNMQITTSFETHPDATPHNPFIKDNYLFLAYYLDGIQIYDISTPATPVQIGFFDTYWQNDALGNYPIPGYAGCWGAYPYLPSGNLIVSDMQNGLYTLDISSVTGVHNRINSNKVHLYPNPVIGNKLNIITPDSKSTEYELLNVQGQVIQKNKLLNSSINVEQLNSGIYTIRLLSDDAIRVEKFVRL